MKLESPSEGIAKAVRLAVALSVNQGTTPPDRLYDVIIGMAEKPLLECVMKHANWSQSRAAEVLGINRNTLRKKMRVHGLLERRP